LSAIPDYRRELKKVLPPHVFKPHPESIVWLFINLVIVGATLALMITKFNYAWAWLGSIVIGHSFGAMGFAAHEICHGSAIKGKNIRPLLAGIGFSPLWIGPYLWTKWHNAEHHNNTQVEGIDPDHLFTMETYQTSRALRALYRLSPIARNLVIFGSFCFRMTQQSMRMWISYFRTAKSFRERWTLIWQLVLPIAFWTAVTLPFGTNIFVFGYIIPLLIANTVAIGYIATNHFLNPLADEKDCLETSLSVTLPKSLGWLDKWHCYFGAHVAHHLFPGVPARHARMIEEKCAELWPDRFHSMPLHKALKALWDTPWVYDGRTQLRDPQTGEVSGTLGHGLGVSVQKQEEKEALVGETIDKVPVEI
jgi:fatty acid desaturase